MEQTIRKNYKQVKKTKGDKNIKPSEKFVDYFKNLEKEEQIKYYEKSIKLLEAAISSEYSVEDRKALKEGLKK